jgi:hypothetical protein
MTVSFQYARRRGRVVGGENPFRKRYTNRGGIWAPPKVETIRDYLAIYYPHLCDEFEECAKRNSPHMRVSEQLNHAFTWSDSPSGPTVWSNIQRELQLAGM